MPPAVATWLTVAFVLLLLSRDALRGEARSGALWLPVMWLGITGSRFVSQWINLDSGPAQNFYEGSPLDAGYFASLILAGMLILHHRGVKVWGLVRANTWVALFVAFGLLSILWSDEPVIAAKRWIKTLGHPIMALIILTEPEPKAALLTVLKRCAFVLLPVSVLFIKYLPQYGRGFDPWTGEAFNNGIGLTKNDLGYICMVFGILFLWSLLTVKRRGGTSHRVDALVSFVFLSMAVWLLGMSDSATSLAGLMLGVAVMIALGLPFVSRRHFGSIVLVGILVAWFLDVTFDLRDNVIAMLGRNPTLTDRTAVWVDVLKLQDKPLLGYGFESFWLGDRLNQMWQWWWWKPTQAHNGFIETYANLGIVGVALLTGMLLSAFRRISLQLQADFDFARLKLALLFAIILFNYTEAGFKGVHFVWTVFYIIALTVPALEKRGKEKVRAGSRKSTRFAARLEQRS